MRHADIDVNIADCDGNTALMYAAYTGNENILKALVSSGHLTSEGIVAVNNGEYNAAMVAAGQGHEEIARILQASITSVIANNRPQSSQRERSIIINLDYNAEFRIAAANGDLVRVQELFNNPEVDPEQRSVRGYTALELARQKNHQDVIDFLTNGIATTSRNTSESQRSAAVEATNVGGSLEARFSSSNTAEPAIDPQILEQLRQAATRGTNADIEIIKNLHLLNNVNINVNTPLDEDGQTLLMYAARNGRINLILALFGMLDTEGLNAVDNKGNTAFMLAAKEGFCSVLNLLLDQKIVASSINVNAQNNFGENILSIAREGGHGKIIQVINQLNIARNNTLIKAIQSNDLGSVQFMLNIPGININLGDSRGITPLMHAMLQRNLKIIQVLLNAPGININATDERGRTAFMYAFDIEIEKSKQKRKSEPPNIILDMVRILASVPNINVNAQNIHDNRATVLTYARNIQGCTQVFEAINAIDIARNNDLREAAKDGDEAVMEHLLQIPGIVDNLNTPDNNGRTVLMYAVEHNRPNIVSMLIAVQGINIYASNQQGKTAYSLANNDSKRIIEKRFVELQLIQAAHETDLKNLQSLLERSNTNINALDSDGSSALMIAAQYGNLNAVKRLLARDDIDINIRGSFGKTALMSASLNNTEKPKQRGPAPVTSSPTVSSDNRQAIVSLLLKAGINANVRNGSGKTALMLAVERGHLEVVIALLQVQGIDVNAVNNNGRTALMEAVIQGNAIIVDNLLRVKNININAIDNTGRTALNYAEENTFIMGVAANLQQRGAKKEERMKFNL